MNSLGIAIVGGIVGSFIGGVFSVFIYILNLKKERFFNLQKKGDELLRTIYEYEELLWKVDMQKNSLEYENQGMKDEQDIHNDMTNKKQRAREKIWSLIRVYFPSLSKSFQEYTSIEMIDGIEKTKDRENKIGDIAHLLIGTIDKERSLLFTKI